MKWLIDPQTDEPVNLTQVNLANGHVMVGNRKLKFSEKDVITGVARAHTEQRGTDTWVLMSRGEVAMATWFVQDLAGVGNNAGIDPDLLSWFP